MSHYPNHTSPSIIHNADPEIDTQSSTANANEYARDRVNGHANPPAVTYAHPYTYNASIGSGIGLVDLPQSRPSSSSSRPPNLTLAPVHNPQYHTGPFPLPSPSYLSPLPQPTPQGQSFGSYYHTSNPSSSTSSASAREKHRPSPLSAPPSQPLSATYNYDSIPAPLPSGSGHPVYYHYVSPPALNSPYSAGFLHPSHPLSTSTSSSVGIERALRSPHPPLTAGLSAPHLWPPPLPSDRSQVPYPAALARPFHSSPLTELPSIPPPNRISPIAPGPPFHQSQSHLYPQSQLPVPFPQPRPHSASSALNLPYLQPLIPQFQTPGIYADSPPLNIPPPLRFNYSASPPTYPVNPQTTMPRVMQAARRGAANHVAATPTSTVQTVSSTTSGSRRKSGASTSGKGMGWTMEQTYDSTGARKEIIVIEDSSTPDRIPRKRTRAMAAAEAAAEEEKQNGGKVNGSVASSAAVPGGSGKKRKIVESSETSVKKTKGKAANTSQSSYVAPVIQPRAPAPVQPPVGAHPPWDDPEGHYIVKPDDVIGGRYKIVRLLGQGTFGKVVEARHIESRRKVAIKIIRAVQKYRDASKIEIRVLETLRKFDARNDNKCIHLEEYFDFRSHPCLVSELYGMSVFDFLKQNGFQPFPEKHIQDFAKSLLKSVQFLHSLKLVHTDLKPENILLVGNEAVQVGDRAKNAKSKRILRNTDIRLIDFGSATFEDEYHSSVVSTRHYRAPEIILGMTWSYPCDIFSIGCILVEFFTGDALFQTHDNLEHLAMMEVVMGKMSTRMIDRGRQKKPEFFRGSKVDYPNPSVSKSSRRFVKGLKSLKDIIAPNSVHNNLFLDLISRMLDFDPERRITVAQALVHPYISAYIPDPEP